MTDPHELTIALEAVRAAQRQRREVRHDGGETVQVSTSDTAHASAALATRLGGLPFSLKPADLETARERRRALADRAQPTPPTTDALHVCAWCGWPIRPQDDPVGPARVCNIDGEIQHGRCWTDGGGCARVGCPNQPRV